MAHNSLTPAKIFYNEGRVENANINRSPTSYLLNPEAEKAKYLFLLLLYLIIESCYPSYLLNAHCSSYTSLSV